MLIDQADLLEGMDYHFIQQFMSLTIKENFGEGEVIFREGDKAENFYTLVEGRIRLSVGEGQKEVYVISHPGEAFGWSSLLDRNYYSASAECTEPTRLHRIEKHKLFTLLESHPEKRHVFYKRLAGMLGHRLVESYKQV